MASTLVSRFASSSGLHHCLGHSIHTSKKTSALTSGASWSSPCTEWKVCRRRWPISYPCGVRAAHSDEQKEEPWKRLQRAASAADESVPSLAAKLGQSSNIVLGDSTSDEEWRMLDEKVNKYPSPRFFTSIGTGDDDFRKSMVIAVESVIGTLPEERVVQRYSGKGKYVSVKIGPIMCRSSDQVVAIYQAMRADPRMLYFI